MLYNASMNNDGYDPIAHVMIGAPGSGKSFMALKLSEIFDSIVVSTDEIRESLYGSEAIQGDWQEIENEMKRRVRCAKATGNNVIIDATHARAKYRKNIAKFLRECGFVHIVPVLVHPPLDTCLEQNRKRERRVPQRVVIQMWQTIEQNRHSLKEEFNN